MIFVQKDMSNEWHHINQSLTPNTSGTFSFLCSLIHFSHEKENRHIHNMHGYLRWHLEYFLFVFFLQIMSNIPHKTRTDQ